MEHLFPPGGVFQGIRQGCGAGSETDSIAVIDARNPDSFNGWIFRNSHQVLEETGGHIPGAELFSARWIHQDMNMDSLERGYSYSGLGRVSQVIIYGQDTRQAETLGNWLVHQKDWADRNIRILEGGIQSWVQQNPDQLDYLPGFKTLVPPQYVIQAIHHNPDIKVVEIGWMVKAKAIGTAIFPGQFTGTTWL